MKKYISLFLGIFLLSTGFSQEEIKKQDLGKTETEESVESEESFDDFEEEFEGFDAIGSENEDKKISVKLAGKLNIGFDIFFKDFKSQKEIEDASLKFPLWGTLSLNAKASMAEAYIAVKLSEKSIPAIELGEKTEIFPKPIVPMWLDEAYLEINLGSVFFGGGLKKITWGIANSMSVLDCINPIDKSDYSEIDYQKRKIASPLFFLYAYLPLEMKLSIVYLPIFEPNRIATSGIWKSNNYVGKIIETNKVKYSQTGIRYTATIDGIHDLGVQYFYGFIKDQLIKKTSTVSDYNSYHQIGITYGTAIGPVNLRTEFAANITNDIQGNNANIENPNLAWNIGFDYTMPYNIMINIEAKETIRLKQSGITNTNDIEYNKSQTNTKLNFTLSQRTLRSALEWKILAIVGIEDKDFLIAPSINMILGDFDIDLKLGFFGGNKNGELGRFRNNHFLKFSIGYTF